MEFTQVEITDADEEKNYREKSKLKEFFLMASNISDKSNATSSARSERVLRELGLIQVLHVLLGRCNRKEKWHEKKLREKEILAIAKEEMNQKIMDKKEGIHNSEKE